MVLSSPLKRLQVAFVLLSVCLLSTADAGLVTFKNINQSGQLPGDPGEPFGPSSVAGNTLTFGSPDTFSASSVNGSFNFDNFTDGFLSFTVAAESDTWITGFSLSENGFQNQFDPPGGPVGTAATGAQVLAFGGIVITELDHGNTAVTQPAAAVIPVNFSQSFDLSDPAGLWNGFDFANLEAVLMDRGITYENGVTEFDFFLNNQLITFSEAGTFSFIDKKRVVFAATTQMIPEPSTLLLFAVALGINGVRRKRNR